MVLENGAIIMNNDKAFNGLFAMNNISTKNTVIAIALILEYPVKYPNAIPKNNKPT
jgi:hypothetical protein